MNEVVVRWGERISFGRLKGVIADQSLIDEVIQGCERLSRYIEGHLHSDMMAKKPTLEALRYEIDAFYKIRRDLADKRKNN